MYIHKKTKLIIYSIKTARVLYPKKTMPGVVVRVIKTLCRSCMSTHNTFKTKNVGYPL